MDISTSTSGILFTKAHKIARNRAYSVLTKYDLNPTYWFILGAALEAPEGIRLSSVATLLGVKAPLITTQAGALINRGLIRRIAHHTDGRAKLLVITAQGKQLAVAIEQELGVAIGSLMEGLSQAEITAFQKTLQTIITNDQK